MSQISPQKLRGLKGVKDQLTNITTSKVLPGAEMSSLTNKNPIKTVILFSVLWEIHVKEIRDE